jgi:CCR4-NOT transcription complex subunit 3
MERFRGCEKETKTKAYSKEGLQKQSVKKDAKGPERNWLQQSTDRLISQLKQLENEMRNLDTEDPDAALERQITLEHRIDRHKIHIDHLQYTLSAWENDVITKDQIKQIQKPIDEYIKNNHVRSEKKFFLGRFQIFFVSLSRYS